MRKILLNKSISKESVNEINILPINLNREVSLLNNEILTDTIDTIEVYNKEKDNSTKHRFIFTLYPICTNVLYNKITEIVLNEGSDSCNVLKDTTKNEELTRLDAIRNTEYSNSVHNYTYHCGVDIFNNHLLRKKEDIYVQNYQIDNGLPNGFNTIKDIYRSVNKSGDKYIYGDIKILVPDNNNDRIYDLQKGEFYGLPIYQYDTIKSFAEAYNTNLKYNNGYIGFYNPSTLPIKVNGKGKDKDNKYYINKTINNAESCQFIDLAPERDLFYFTPKINQYRKRIEYNWDYCLTYAYKDDCDGVFLNHEINGLPLIKYSNSLLFKKTIGGNGLTTLMFRSACKHNLKINDNIKLKFINNKASVVEEKIKEVICRVINVGDNQINKNENYYFSIIANDISDIIQFDEDGSVIYNFIYDDIRFSKIISGYECRYYFHKLKSITNLRSSLNKLSFSNTIYGDDVSQLVFTDDVNIKDLKDNLGRPLTEIYLTLIKNNKGYKKWYVEQNYVDSGIEFSHVFGQISSGLDLPPYVKENNIKFPTIRGQHNIERDQDGRVYYNNNTNVNIYVDKSCGSLENSITLDNNDFFGSLIEFNPVTLEESVLESIKHRFNTAQREIKQNINFNTIYHDEIISDFYDYKKGSTTNYKTNIETQKYNSGYANLAPEGYIYEPHYRIKIGEYDDIVKQASDILMNISNEFTLYVDNNNSNEYLVFSTNINYGILPGDLVSYCEKDGKNLKKFRVLNYYSTQNQNVNIFYFSCGNIKNENEQFTLCELESDDDKELFKKANELQKFYIDGEISKDKDGDYIVNNKKLKDSGILINNNFLKYVIDNKKEYQIKCGVNMSTKLFDTSIYSFFQHNLEIPEYAYMLPDGTGRHLWREIKKPSIYNFNSELYNVPFTNGAFYHQTNILFPVKRQDPKREYEMFLRQGNGNGPIIENNFEISSDNFDISSEEYIDNTIGQTCF